MLCITLFGLRCSVRTDVSRARTLGSAFGHGLGSLPCLNSSALQVFFLSCFSFITPLNVSTFHRMGLLTCFGFCFSFEVGSCWVTQDGLELLTCLSVSQGLDLQDYTPSPNFIHRCECVCTYIHEHTHACIWNSASGMYVCLGLGSEPNLLVWQASWPLWSIVQVLFLEAGFPCVAQADLDSNSVSSPESWDHECIPVPLALSIDFYVIFLTTPIVDFQCWWLICCVVSVYSFIITWNSLCAMNILRNKLK